MYFLEKISYTGKVEALGMGIPSAFFSCCRNILRK